MGRGLRETVESIRAAERKEDVGEADCAVRGWRGGGEIAKGHTLHGFELFDFLNSCPIVKFIGSETIKGHTLNLSVAVERPQL